MSTLIEQVAKAIASAALRAQGQDPLGHSPQTGPELNNLHYTWRSYLPHAEAAIQAMRKASQPMSWAGGRCINGTNAGSRAYRVWEAMIDEALK